MKRSLSLSSKLALSLLLASIASLASAQLKTPAPSPHSSLTQTVGLTEVSIDYSRPGMKGRAIFGELVPFGEVWRTGANKPTRITFSDAVTLGGTDLEAGTYALYTIPGKNEWTVIVYADTELWGAFGYDKANDVTRFKVKSKAIAERVESLTIGFDSLHNDGATLYIAWDKTRIDIPLKVHSHEAVMSQIEELKGTPGFESVGNLYSAGSYFYESGEDLEQALEWVTAACEKSDSPAYWMLATKARIELKLGRTGAAKASAQKALELAIAGKNPDYEKIAKDILAQL